MFFNNSYNELYRLQRNMNQLFDDYNLREEQFPAVNVWSNDENVMVTTEMPGLEANAFNLKVSNDQLTIEATRKEAELKDVIYHRKERMFGDFSRIIELPYEVQEDKVAAQYKNGTLKITLPRKETTKPKKIAISVG